MPKSFWIILILVFILSGAGYVSSKLKLGGVSKSIQGSESIILDLWLDEVPSTTGELFKNSDYTNLLVRNRPHGKLQIVNSRCVPLSTDRYYIRRVSIPTEQAKGEAFEEPFLWQCRLTLRDPHALSTANGYLSQGNQLKIGSRIALEGKIYRVDGYIVNVKPEI
jgi:Domain of unknown function (DUF4330)